MPASPALHSVDCRLCLVHCRLLQPCLPARPFARLPARLQGDRECVDLVARSGLDVFAHNVETVPRLQGVVRDRRANWEQSLGVLRAAKEAGARVTKTSIMLGCGERPDEVVEALKILRLASWAMSRAG